LLWPLLWSSVIKALDFNKVHRKEKKRKLRKQQKSSSHQLRKKGPLGKKSPFTR